MSRDGTADGLQADFQAAPGGPGRPAAELLDACDRVLQEPGRRRHLFSWLRAPDAPRDGWLAVDAYYPASRLVAVIGPPETPGHAVCRELVPPRGLRLLVLDPEQLPTTTEALEAELRELITELGPAPARAHEAPLPGDLGPSLTAVTFGRVAAAFAHQPAATPPPPRRVGPSQAAAAERAARFVAAQKAAAQGAVRRPAPPPAARSIPPRRNPQGVRRPEPQAVRRPEPQSVRRRNPQAVRRAEPQAVIHPIGVLLGVVAVVIVLAEVYLAVGRIALPGGSLMLGFGLALDACARALGAVAASRAGDERWAWLSVLGGSPAVAAFALYQPEGPVRVDPAPLAGLISLLASALVSVSLLGMLLGI